MSFAEFNLDPSIVKAITACGYTTPTTIQKRAIPEVLNGNDLVACAPTGTGKTAAFVLPSLHRVREPNAAKKPRILILTPTRELAAQITQAAGNYGKFLRFNMASLVGGMSYRQQMREMSRPVDMIVATPGRLLDHMENRRIDLSGIEMLVLDEADRMLDMGFIDDVQAIAKATPRERQTLLFSATVDGKLGQIIKQLLKEPVHIDLSGERISPAQIKQEVYMADSISHKNRLLEHMLANDKIFKAIIFTATKIGADQLAGQLLDLGYLAAPLHGDLKQSLRNRTIEQLRRNKIQFLVATDVAARGIDIADMTHVINFDLPRFSEDYVHRIGRTGRAGKTGIAISLALHNDQRHIDRIEKYIGQKLERLTIEGLEPSGKASKGKDKKAFVKRGNGPGKKSYGQGRPREEGRFASKKPFEKNGDSKFKSKFRSSEGSSEQGSGPKRDYSKSSGDTFARKDFKGEGRSKFARSDDGAPRKSFKKSDDAGRFASRSDDGAPRKPFKKSGDTGRFASRSDDGAPRRTFKKTDDSSRFASRSDDGAPRKSYKKSDDTGRFASRSDDGAPRKSYKKSDEGSRFASRSDDGAPRRTFKKTDEKSRFGRSDDAGAPRRFARPDAAGAPRTGFKGPEKTSRFGRKDDAGAPRREFKGEGKSKFARSDDGAPRKGGFKSSEGKRSFARPSDAGSRSFSDKKRSKGVQGRKTQDSKGF